MTDFIPPTPWACAADAGSRCLDAIDSYMVVEKLFQLLSRYERKTSPNIQPNDTPAYRCLKANSLSSVVNSQPAGIGTIAVKDDGFLINTIGRNVFAASFAEQLCKSRLVLQESVYQDDKPSQFDLDVHALIFAGGLTYAVNHFGHIRILSGNQQVDTKEWPGDCEQFIVARNCLISTSPRGYESGHPAAPGLVIADAELEQSPVAINNPRLIHPELGITTAIAIDTNHKSIAVAANDTVTLFELDGEHCQPLVMRKKAQTTVPFCVTHITFLTSSEIVLAGPAINEQADDNWDSLVGGSFVVVNNALKILRQQSFNDVRVAWGNGATAVLVDESSQSMYALDRFAQLHEWNLKTLSYRLLHSSSLNESQGIAHAAYNQQLIVCGYNRGGHVLHVYDPARLKQVQQATTASVTTA